MSLPFQKAIILAPHTDDGELGCGGTINRLIEENKEVYYIAFSTCEESVPEGFPKNALEIEVKEATAILGITSENLVILNYPVRKFGDHRQNILEHLVSVKKDIDPDLILMPSSKSIHQDHITIYNEGLRAFKHCCCLGYDLPWDTQNFLSGFFVQLEQRHISKKYLAIQQYKTQQLRRYCSEEFVYGLSTVRGTQIDTQYAEAFEPIRLIY